MLFVVFGADCGHVGNIYECPQGTYAIGRRAPLQNNFIYTKTQTTKIFVMIPYNIIGPPYYVQSLGNAYYIIGKSERVV